MNRARRILVAAFASILLTPVVPAIATAAESRGAAECASSLDCSIDEINAMPMAERIEFVRAMERGPAAEALAGYAPRWRNIEGVIDFFRDDDIGAPNSWISWVDAGIVEGIERGIAIALGRTADTGGNPGSLLWASYVDRLRAGQLSTRHAHDKAWGEAEQASTEHGKTVAERVNGIQPSAADMGLYQFSEIYRLAMRHQPGLFAAPVGPGDQRQLDFINWFTDVTNSTPARKGSEFAYRYGQLNLAGGTLGVVDTFQAYVVELWDEFQAETGAGPMPAEPFQIE